MTNVTSMELIGLFESIAKNDEKADGYRSQAKMIDSDSLGQFKEFAKEKELNAKDLKKAYKYWVELQDSNDASTNEDFFTLCAIIDGGLNS